ATQALERARTTRPDVIALDDSLLDADPLETSRALRDDPLVGASTPILLVTGRHAAPPEHQRALRAGVREVLPYPVTADEASRARGAGGCGSCATGRIGPAEFAAVAPGTDGVGAVMLAQRVARAMRAASGDQTPPLRAGYDAVGNTRYTPVEPKNLLARAASALRLAKSEAATNWIRAFDA